MAAPSHEPGTPVGPGEQLTRGSVLARGTVLNLVGLASPALVGLFAVPPLVHGLGPERFGLLTLMWLLVGTLGLLDLGLGRALTRETAAALGSGRSSELPALIWTSLAGALAIGTVGALLGALLTPWLVRSVLSVPAALEAEAVGGFLVLSLSIPLIVTGAGLRGVLEAQQRFGVVNGVRGLAAAVGFLAPLALLPFTKDLGMIAWALVLARAVAWLVSLLACLAGLPALRRGIPLRAHLLRPLLAAGGWMTASNVLGPALGYADRMVIAAGLSVAHVAYYATPADVLMRMWVLPGAVVATLFPAFTAAFAAGSARATLLFERGIRYVFLALFPVVVVLVAFADELLAAWLGPTLGERCASVTPWLAVAVFVTALAHVPLVMLQAAGRSDVVARLQAAELVPYVALVWWAAARYGITGVAVAYLVRNVLETGALVLMAIHELPRGTDLLPGLGFMLLGTMAPLLLTLDKPSVPVAGLVVGAILLAFLGVAWRRLLSGDERAWLRDSWRRLGAW